MRTIIVISTLCELALVAGAMLAGAPVAHVLRAGARRAANVAILCALALVSWVLAGLAINGLVGQLPGGGRFAATLVRIGAFEFNLVVLAPMLLVSLALAYVLVVSLAAAAMGRGLAGCARAALRVAPQSRSRAALPAGLSER